MQLPRVVLTNDDGIDSPGLTLFAERLSGLYDLVVAAPAADMSGSGTGIGPLGPDLGVTLESVSLDGITGYTVDGPPGLAVMAAALGAFGRAPDLVVSGVNAGMNTGHSVIHSGTVGAVLTAKTFGGRGLAVSLAQSDPWQWETAVAVGMAAAGWMLADRGRPDVLNVNVPGVALDQVAGVHWADLDEFGYFRLATADLTGKKLQFVIGPASAGSDPASDTALCARNYVSVTPLGGVGTRPFPDIEAGSIWHQ
jgi:5'-nucleotidase